jgi:hypothetical protein
LEFFTVFYQVFMNLRHDFSPLPRNLQHKIVIVVVVVVVVAVAAGATVGRGRWW